MQGNAKLDQILVLDIETVPQYEHYADVPMHFRALWEQKTERLRKDGTSAEAFYEKAGIWAEFGKIICISVATYHWRHKQFKLKVQSFALTDERLLLQQFASFLQQNTNIKYFCAHNGKEFDYPYLCRRFLINKLALPQLLNLSGKKPWEINHLDTLELWKFGDYKNYTSLNLLAAVFDLPTPKADIDGSQVKAVYYQQNDLARITAYCENDVVTTAQILLRFMDLPIISAENITLVR